MLIIYLLLTRRGLSTM